MSVVSIVHDNESSHQLFRCHHFSCLLDNMVVMIQKDVDDPTATAQEKYPYIMTVNELNKALKEKFPDVSE